MAQETVAGAAEGEKYGVEWKQGFIRPTLQNDGASPRKMAEEAALLRVCKETANECPGIGLLVIRSSVHVTTFSRMTRRVSRAPAHITGGYYTNGSGQGGPARMLFLAHVHVDNYRGPRETEWRLLTRRDVTWGPGGKGPVYPGWKYGVVV